MDVDDFVSFNGGLLDGYSEKNFSYRPIDTTRLDERALHTIYNRFLDYFSLYTMSFRPSAFHGYDLAGVIGVWSYCYSVNYLEAFDPSAARSYDEANENFLWKPPASVHEKVHDYFIAPIVEGENPALLTYSTLKEQIRRHGEKPSNLSKLSFDDLLLAVDHVGHVRYWAQFSGVAESYMSTPLGLLAYKASVRALGVVGMVAGGTDFYYGILESALDEEILRRIDADPNDELDEAFLRARTRSLNLNYVTLDIGTR